MAFEFDAEKGSQEKYSAGETLKPLNRESDLDRQREGEAEAAGLSNARFAGYADVLGLYEQRSDTEHLADRRARHYAATVADQDFTRHADYDGNSGTEKDQGTTAPTPPTEPAGDGT